MKRRFWILMVLTIALFALILWWLAHLQMPEKFF